MTQGIEDWDEGVVHQCLELFHRYAADILQDARVYAEHAGREQQVGPEDVKLAVQSNLQHEFTAPPNREQLTELSAATNRVPLPEPPSQPGIVLPPQHNLVSPNYQVNPSDKDKGSRKRPREDQ